VAVEALVERLSIRTCTGTGMCTCTLHVPVHISCYYHDIAEILLKVALNTIRHTIPHVFLRIYFDNVCVYMYL
jgi:hypothetical protein